MHCFFGAAVVQRRFTTTATTTPLSLAGQGKGAFIKYHDGATWPKYLTAADIEDILAPHLVDGATPNYNSLAVLLQLGDVRGIN